jgi:hypothetical protein
MAKKAKLLQFPHRQTSGHTDAVLQVPKPSTGELVDVHVDAADVPFIKARGKLSVTPQNYVIFTRRRPNSEHALHRFLLCPEGLIPRPICVDHKDQNTANNKRSNLRLVSPAENLRNTDRPVLPPKSGQVGVYPYLDGQWLVKLSIDGAAQSFGIFSDLEAAKAKARSVIRERDGRIEAAIRAFEATATKRAA